MEKSYVGMSQCFFCGEPKEVILDRRLKNTLPRLACYDKEPCQKCKDFMSKGVMLISVANGTDKENPYRTGKVCVITVDAAKRIFNNIGENKVAFVEDEVWNLLKLPT